MKPLSRRTILHGGGASLALPWLQAMIPGERRARAAQRPPKRFLAFFTPNGTIREHWLPRGGETDFSFGRILAPLERHKRDLVVLDGIDNVVAGIDGPGDDHMRGMASLLTGLGVLPGKTQGGGMSVPAGLASGISVDQEMVRRLRPPTRFPSLELGIQTNKEGTAWAYSNYRGPAQPLPLDNNPRSVFGRIFQDMVVAGADNSGSERLRTGRRTVLSAVMDDYRRMVVELGVEDRRRLQSHLSAVDELETRILRPRPPVEVAGCHRPQIPNRFDHMANENFPEVGRLQMDLMVNAMACDLTRFGTLQWSRSVGGTTHTWVGALRGHHDLSHDPDSNTETVETLTRINTWYAEQFAYLIDRMKEVPEGDGTLLDNTLIFWCNELSRGNFHSHPEMPYVLAGRAGGALKTGRFLSYSGGDVAHNDLLVSILNGFDVPATTFGNREVCRGPLTALF